MFTEKRCSISIFILIIGFTSLPGITTQVFAGQKDANKPADLFEMSLEELMNVPIDVSASRQAQKLGELSVPVSVITAEDIRYSGLTNIPEILQFPPSVDMLKISRFRYAVGVRRWNLPASNFPFDVPCSTP
jgi:outer membrane receptor protein involved in Fe transport